MRPFLRIYCFLLGCRKYSKENVMMIPGASALPNFGLAISASHSGRMSLPVSPALYIYSQFEHVAGVPAPEGTRGVAITKLKILNAMIDQLNQIKKQSTPDTENLSNEQIDALISKYEGQIKAAQAASAVMPYAPVPQAPAGLLFSISA
jgi:hypothetical protein